LFATLLNRLLFFSESCRDCRRREFHAGNAGYLQNRLLRGREPGNWCFNDLPESGGQAYLARGVLSRQHPLTILPPQNASLHQVVSHIDHEEGIAICPLVDKLNKVAW
jgi:hypothetical protein